MKLLKLLYPNFHNYLLVSRYVWFEAQKASEVRGEVKGIRWVKRGDETRIYIRPNFRFFRVRQYFFKMGRITEDYIAYNHG